MSCQGYGGQGWKGGLWRLKYFGKKQVLGGSVFQVLSLRHKLDIVGRSLERHRAERSSRPEEGLLAGYRNICSCESSWLNRDSIPTRLMYQEK